MTDLEHLYLVKEFQVDHDKYNMNNEGEDRLKLSE